MSYLISTNGKKTKVSHGDYSFLSQWNWHCNKCGYFICSSRGLWGDIEVHTKRLHWFVMRLKGVEIPAGFQIDHRDRDKSNNTRSNLRLSTPQTQQYNTDLRSTNTSGYKGVCFVKAGKRQKRWQASCRSENGTMKSLGIFNTPEEAAASYVKAASVRNKSAYKKAAKGVK